jgi:hypothetical protein
MQMLNSKSQSKIIKRRLRRGSLIGENACVLYLLFLFIFFPLLDLGAMGLRMFCLWFACNQAAMAGAKGTKWSVGNVSGSTNYANSIQTQAMAAATNTVNAFSGISMNAGYPKLTVILRAIEHSDTSANQISAATSTYTGTGPLATPVDISQYVPILQVQIMGVVQPFITIPFLVGVPGLSSPFTVNIYSQQQIEDAQALSS